MGDNNKHVKSVKNFDFNKSKEKRFDFTKDDKPVRKKNRLLWGFCVILIIVVAAVFLFLKNASSKKDTTNIPTIEVVDSILTTDSVTAIQDSIQQDESVADESVVNTNGDSVQEQSTSASVDMSTKSVEQMAWSVIRGNYDNNPIRRQKLGEDYQVIQDKVNEFYRKGLVH